MPLELIAATVLLPVTVMVAVAVLWSAVGLTNQVIGAVAPARTGGLDRGSAYFRPLDPNEVLPIPEPSFHHTPVSVLGAAVLTLGLGYIAGFLLLAWEVAATVRPISAGEVFVRMSGTNFLLALVPVFLLLKARVLCGLLRTSYPRAVGVVVSEVVIWAILGLTAASGLLLAGFPVPSWL